MTALLANVVVTTLAVWGCFEPALAEEALGLVDRVLAMTYRLTH